MFLRFNILGFTWALIILVLCLFPSDQLPRNQFWDLFSLDKTIHLSLFTMQVLLLVVGFKRQYSSYYLRYYCKPLAFLSGLSLGLITELLQLTMSSGRQFDTMDFLADGIGCLIGLLLFRLVYGRELSS